MLHQLHRAHLCQCEHRCEQDSKHYADDDDTPHEGCDCDFCDAKRDWMQEQAKRDFCVKRASSTPSVRRTPPAHQPCP